jgi:uncharacterized beta-barrel protein YwiB (DUF1934 family)
MKRNVMLSIAGRQNYVGQDPEVIELVTEGTLEQTDTGWIIAYEESDLTGMQGVMTTFQLENGKLILTRSGKLNSQMIFQEGVRHESLYQMEFGALMLCVCARKIRTELTADGGTVDLSYAIEIEQTETGVIDYHLDIRAK